MMGLVYSEITMANPVEMDAKPIKVKCLAETGSTYLVIPEHIAAQLHLTTRQMREVTMVVRSSHTVPYAGPARITFENRNCFVGTLIMGNEVLIDVVPMEDMDSVILPKLLKLSVNPESPNIPRGHAKLI